MSQLPDDTWPPSFGAVAAPYWDDKPLAIVGTGPSLRGFDFERLRDPRWRVLAVKAAWEDLPFADAVFGLDLPWMRRERERIAALAEHTLVYLAVPCAEPPVHRPIPGAIYLRRERFETLSDNPGVIQSGGNSGAGAFNLAYLKRAKRIVLFGFDYATGDHYCADRYGHQTLGGVANTARYMPRWATNFDAALPQLQQAGVAVINASPRSSVTAFPKYSIDAGVLALASPH